MKIQAVSDLHLEFPRSVMDIPNAGIVCNPAGYPMRADTRENPNFNPSKLMEIMDAS